MLHVSISLLVSGNNYDQSAEEERDSSRIPTRYNMTMALHWLVGGCQSGDSLVFHYSGHGSQVPDTNGDEIDGYDEALCPVDYQTKGKILDDEINAIIVRPLPPGARLHAIIDTCNSGTVLDLAYMCRISPEGLYGWEDQWIPQGGYKGTSGGIAISLTACDDNQNSGDTTAFNGNASGALTYTFINILQNEPRPTYERLLSSMRYEVREAQNRAPSSLPHSPQVPQLSSSQKFDIHKTPFTL
ncbi:unnamed protein product [Ilex paraguariensis]|uniref:Peptidase C14 caspase domain-containing protein n=1 Tax=Ilex paraguariensis TaxID=185542 RepID=A0ABC8T127_9AQUA